MKVNDRLIEQLYCGNIVPSNSFTHKTDNYLSASEQNEKIYEQLVKTLDENQSNLLEELLEAKAIMSDEMVFGAFKDGFKLGMGLAVEGLSSNFADDNCPSDLEFEQSKGG